MSRLGGGVPVEVSSRSFAVPFECPCCGAVPDTEITVPLERSAPVSSDAPTARGIAFPYCKRCVEHSSQWESAGLLAAAVTLGGVISGVVIAAATRTVLGVAVLAAAVASGAGVRAFKRGRARARCTPACAAPGRAVGYLGWSGASSGFTFASPSYAARFAEQNAKLLANPSPALRKLLDAFKAARLQVPTPAAATGVVPPPLTVIEWISRIERSPGRVARRAALVHALEMFPDAPARTQVLEAATREELATYFAELDRAPNASALLSHAIAEVEADNMPEPLQRAVLDALEQRARGLR